LTEEETHDDTRTENGEAVADAGDAVADAGDAAESDDSLDLSQWPLLLATAGLALGLCFSNRLWTGIGKSFPAAAIVSCPLSPGIDQVLSGLVLLCCCLIVANKFRLAGTITLFASLFVLVLFDINRFQPWLYEYLIIIFLCSVPDNRSHLSIFERSHKKLQFISLLLISVYFFSGLEKLNWRFLTIVGPWLLGLSHSLTTGIENDMTVIWMSASMAVAETGLAVLLCFSTTRMLGVALGTLMHATIFYVLGPFKMNTNPAVWPWNLTQITLLIYCFMNISDQPIFKINLKESRLSAFVMTVVALVIPTLGLLQLVDPYPAFSFYTGDVPTGKIMFEKSTFEQLPKNVQTECGFYDERTGLWYADTNDWLYLETGASAYPSFFCFRLEARKFAQDHPGQLVVLKLYSFPKLTKAARDHFEKFGEAAPANQLP